METFAITSGLSTVHGTRTCLTHGWQEINIDGNAEIFLGSTNNCIHEHYSLIFHTEYTYKTLYLPVVSAGGIIMNLLGGTRTRLTQSFL